PSDARFCPACQSPVVNQAVKLVRRFRWRNDEAECAKCKSFVKLNGGFCHNCSAPAPRVVCPVCRNDRTELAGKSLAIGNGVALLIMAGGAGNRVVAVVTWEDLIYATIATLCAAAGTAILVAGLTGYYRKIKCSKCGSKTSITGHTLEIVDPSQAELKSTIMVSPSLPSTPATTREVLPAPEHPKAPEAVPGTPREDRAPGFARDVKS